MKNIILIFIVYLLTSSTNLFSQVYQHSTLPTNYFVKDGCFINANTGWLITDGSVQILKTTNKGNNWVMIYDFQNAYTIENSHTISFINENVGWLSFGKNGNPISYEIYKTTNSGINWNLIYTTNSNENILEGNIKFFNEIEGYFLTNYNAKLLKTTNGGYNWNLKYVHSDYGARLTNIQVSPLNSNIIYVSGMTGTLLEENLKSIYLKSTNKFDSYIEILDGINDPNGYGGTSYLSCVNDNGNDLVRNIFSKGFYKLKSDNSFEEISTYNSLRDILSFSQNNKNIGFVSSYRRTDITSNGGVNWITENTLNSGCISGASQFNHIYYLYGWQMPFISRLLAMDLSIIADIELISGNMIFDGENKPVSSQGTSYYLRGGYSNLYADNVLNSGLSNERIFYKWQNNNMNSPLFNYYFDSPGEISAYYKTKLQSTTENAINIPS